MFRFVRGSRCATSEGYKTPAAAALLALKISRLTLERAPGAILCRGVSTCRAAARETVASRARGAVPRADPPDWPLISRRSRRCSPNRRSHVWNQPTTGFVRMLAAMSCTSAAPDRTLTLRISGFRSGRSFRLAVDSCVTASASLRRLSALKSNWRAGPSPFNAFASTSRQDDARAMSEIPVARAVWET
jgi:hypothetical protein